MHLCESSLCACVGVRFHVSPAVDHSVSLLCPAAAFSPRPLVVVPGQAPAAVHCDTVAELVTHSLVSVGFSKVSIQQGHVTNP